MLARGSHNMILLNSFNKFSIKPTLIQYPLCRELYQKSGINCYAELYQWFDIIWNS
jgi:hypothetical protein